LVGTGDRDHCYRHRRLPRAVRPRPSPDRGRAKRQQEGTTGRVNQDRSGRALVNVHPANAAAPIRDAGSQLSRPGPDEVVRIGEAEREEQQTRLMHVVVVAVHHVMSTASPRSRRSRLAARVPPVPPPRTAILFVMPPASGRRVTFARDLGHDAKVAEFGSGVDVVTSRRPRSETVDAANSR